MTVSAISEFIDEDTSLEAIQARFLREYPNAEISMETMRGIPLIIDASRRNATGLIAYSGVAYPVFEDYYSETVTAYEFHTVHADTLEERVPYAREDGTSVFDDRK